MLAGERSWTKFLMARRPARPHCRLRLDYLEDRSVPAFINAPAFPVGSISGTDSNPQAVVVGDFNGDGNLDAATANTVTSNVSVLFGTGSGSFAPAKNIGIGIASGAGGLLAVDLNMDGRLDLVTADTWNDTGTILLSSGTGSFTVAGTVPAGEAPVWVASGDVDGDGNVDLAFADAGTNLVTVMNGTGTGGFGPGRPFVVGNGPTGVVLADFNGDGRPDLASVSGGYGHLDVNLNDGTGSFGAAVNYETGYCANGVTAGDFNRDGKVDLAVGCAFPSDDGVSILLGNGDGTFQTFQSYSAGFQTPITITIGDLDGDGNLDLVTANGQIENNSVSVLMGTPDGTFNEVKVFTAGADPVAAAVGDFNGDGVPDVVAASRGRVLDTYIGAVELLLGNGDGTLLSAESLVVPGPGETVAGDFTGDGLVDLAAITYVNSGYGKVDILPGSGNGLFGDPIETEGIIRPSGLRAGDFNGDAILDLAVATADGVSILPGKGDGTFGGTGDPDYPRLDIAVGDSPVWVAVADVDGDAKDDIVLALSDGSAGAAVLLQLDSPASGVAAFASPVTVAVGGVSHHLVVADLNGDGKKDLAVLHDLTRKVTVVPGLGSNGAFGSPTEYDTGVGPGAIAVGDFNRDGKPDLAVTAASGPGMILTNTGGGAFSMSSGFRTDAVPTGVAAIDFNGDDKLDLVAANSGADNVTVVLGNGNGTFSDPLAFAVGRRPKYVTAADFNRDGMPDVAVSNLFANTITVLQSPSTAAARFRVKVLPTSIMAGNQVQVLVGALDNGGRMLTSYTGTVKLTSTDAAAGLPAAYTFTAADGGWHRFLVTLKTVGSQGVTATAGSISGSGSTTVTSAPATHLKVTAATNAVAGTPIDFTVTALDKFNNVAEQFAGTVHVTTNDPNGSLPPDYTFDPATDHGTHVFTGGATLRTAGARTISAKPTTGTWTAAVGNVNVVAAAASQFSLTGPATVTAGVAYPLTVTARDQYGNLATAYIGTALFTSSDGQAALPADTPFTTGDKGVKVVQAVLRTAGAQAITASASGLTPATRDNIQVKAGLAAGVTFLTPPGDGLANTPLKPTIKVRVADAFGNPVGAGSKVKLYVGQNGTNPSGGRVTSPTAKTLADGTATFPKAAITKGGVGYELVAKAGTGTSVPTVPFTVYTTSKFGLTLSARTTTAGNSLTLTVTALDRFNHQDATYRGTVHFNSPAGLLPDYSFLPGDNGQKAFDVTLTKAGTQTIAVADTTNSKVKGSVKATVTAGAVAKFQVSGFPASFPANKPHSFVVVAQDQYGNTVTGYVGTVKFTSSDAQAVLPQPYQFKTSNKGKHTFVATFRTKGPNQSLTVEDAGEASLKGSETGIMVT